MKAVSRAVVAAFVCVSPAAAKPLPIQLASHRATYDVSLERTTPGSFVSVHGRTITEFRDVCTGWSTTQRFVVDMADADGNVARADFSIVMWESKDGRTMKFKAINVADNKVDEKENGTATVSAGGGEATLTAGKDKRFALPADTLFPTRHTVDLIESARSGAANVRRTVFQGGGKDELYLALATAGRPASPAQTAAERRVDAPGLLKNEQAYPVLLSFFPYGSDGDAPDYEIASHLYANGVIGSMSLIYPRFTMRAQLVKLERLSPICR